MELSQKSKHFSGVGEGRTKGKTWWYRKNVEFNALAEEKGFLFRAKLKSSPLEHGKGREYSSTMVSITETGKKRKRTEEDGVGRKRERNRGKKRMSEHMRVVEVKIRAMIRFKKQEGMDDYRKGLRKGEFKFEKLICKQAVKWGQSLGTVQVERSDHFHGCYVDAKDAILFTENILVRKGMFHPFVEGQLSVNLWLDSRDFNVNGSKDAVPDGVEINWHTSKGKNIRVKNLACAVTPMDADIDHVQDDFMTFLVAHSFKQENHQNQHCMLELLQLDKIDEVAGIPVVFYCSSDKHSLDCMIPGCHGDPFSAMEALDGHPVGSLLSFVPWRNIIWDPDHHSCVVLNHLVQGLYDIAEDRAGFKCRVQELHSTLKKWDVGDPSTWHNVKTYISWSDKDKNLKIMAGLVVAVQDTCGGDAASHIERLIELLLKVVCALMCKVPTAEQLEKVEDWAKELEEVWGLMMEVPDAVAKFCKWQPRWLQWHKSLYRLRTEGREKSNKVHNKYFRKSWQFKQPNHGVTGDVHLMMKVIQAYVVRAGTIGDALMKTHMQMGNVW